MIITNYGKSDSKTGRKNNMSYDIPISFRYILKDITLFCKNCNERIITKADENGRLDNESKYQCKCGTTYKIPSHYVDTYHNKKTKVMKDE